MNAREFSWGFQTASNIDLEMFLAKVIGYADRLPDVGKDDAWLTLTGETGCGKTHLAERLKRYWNAYHLARWRKVRIGDQERDTCKTERAINRFWPQVMRDIRDTSKPDPIPEMETAGLLVIDDIGAEQGHGWTAEQSTEAIMCLLRRRIGQPTVFTSNYGIEDLERRDKRLLSRLNRHGEIYHCEAEDFSLNRPEPEPEPELALALATNHEPEHFDADSIKDPGIREVAERIARLLSTN